MSPQDQQTVTKIRADHWPTKVKIPGRWFRQKRCVLDGQQWPCLRASTADDIERGIRDAAGTMRIPQQRTRRAAWWEV